LVICIFSKIKQNLGDQLEIRLSVYYAIGFGSSCTHWRLLSLWIEL